MSDFVHDYVREVMKGPSTGNTSLVTDANGYATVNIAYRPAYVNHPGHRVRATQRKHKLREQAKKSHAPSTESNIGLCLNILAAVQAENKAKKASNMLSKNKYMQELQLAGFDGATRKKIEMFVDRVWEGEV